MHQIWPAASRLVAALAFGGCLAAAAVFAGTGDLESYEHAVFSLDRGTAVQTVSVAGQPAHTLSLGFGVRLPMHGSLGASPAALLARSLPTPITYWLLLTFTIAAAVLLTRQALEPTCGPLVAWMAAVPLFCSVPMVNYTVFDDWPETAVTYCAFVACVVGPHAMLEALDRASAAGRWIGAFSAAATLWALLVLAHPGYWPLLTGTLGVAGVLMLGRLDRSTACRRIVFAALVAIGLTAIGLPAPDVLRDLEATTAGGDTDRAVDTLSGSLLGSNLFPFGELGPRFPFTYLILAAVSMLVGAAAPRTQLRVLILASAVASIAFAFVADLLSPRGTVASYAPSASWALRDPAGVFAVVSGAWAAAAARAGLSSRRFLKWGAAAAIGIAALQGPVSAAQLVRERGIHEEAWTRDLAPVEERLARRGLSAGQLRPGQRVALWPGVREAMRDRRTPSTDFADAGYPVVTAWTKQRTMRGLIEPNGVLFNQNTELPMDVLCDGRAVHFLQLRYLLRPADVPGCAPWSPVDLRIDGWLEVDAAREADDRIRALPAARLAEPLIDQPALSDESDLVAALTPLPDTSLTIESPRVVLRLRDPSAALGQVLVLPVAYDGAWRTPSGEVRNVAGLLAVVGVEQGEVTLTFVPDLVAALRAVAMTLAQILAVAGIVGLAYQPSGALRVL